MKHSPFDATISALDVETSVVGTATSALSRSFCRYCRLVSGDCGVGITPQVCNRVTNHEDMGTFSRPALRVILIPVFHYLISGLASLENNGFLV